VTPRPQRKCGRFIGPPCAPLGLWHLCADSDEGGGFYAGCDHDHSSAEEAQDCLEAHMHIGRMTGFPLEFDLITIIGGKR